MTTRDEQLQQVLDRGIVAIIRAPSGEQLVDVAQALLDGGIDVIEVTFTVPGILDIIQQLHRKLGDQILLGAGTVLDPESARAAILAGAEFLVTPTINEKVIRLGRRYGKLVMSGAFTPTEILTAWETGADIVKVFPADVGGPAYLKAIHGPLPQIRLLPTGGVNLDTLPKFIHAGACAVGLGSSLVTQADLKQGDLTQIRDRAAAYVEAIQTARDRQ